MATVSVFTDTILSTSLKSLKVCIQLRLAYIYIYIYTITSSLRCIPSLIHLGLPAHKSDIQVGDIIVEVESTDVTRANGDLVVSIVRLGFESLHVPCKQLSVRSKCDNWEEETKR